MCSGLQKSVPLWLVVAAMLLTACAKETSTPVDDGKATLESYSSDNRRASSEALVAAAASDPAPMHQAFAFDDFRARADGGNTLTAPFDVQQLLASLAPGATGETLQAIADAGGWPSLADSAAAETLAGLSLWEQRIDGLDSIERQRWLWGQTGYRFDRDYLRSQAELFGPAMRGVDFRGDFFLAREAIKGASDDGLALEDIDARSRLFLAQTTRLQVAWPDGLTVEPFEGRFGEHEQQRRMPMLRIGGELSLAAGEDYRAVAVPLAEDGLSLLVITPAAGSFDTLRSRLDATFWRQLMADLAPTQATLSLPVFSLQRNLSDEDLPGLGIALSEAQADFSPVNGAGFLYLKPLRQSIELDVGEIGVSAATVTAVVHTAAQDEPLSLFSGGYSSLTSFGGGAFAFLSTLSGTIPCFYPPDQRPFLFAVYDRDTATLLHIGQVKVLEGSPVAADWTVPTWTACGDSPLVEVYQYKGSQQCAFDSGTPAMEMVQTLTDAAIDVTDYTTGTDGKDYLQVCGGPDGVINIFTIHESQLADAEALGFAPLAALNK